MILTIGFILRPSLISRSLPDGGGNLIKVFPCLINHRRLLVLRANGASLSELFHISEHLFEKQMVDVDLLLAGGIVWIGDDSLNWPN